MRGMRAIHFSRKEKKHGKTCWTVRAHLLFLFLFRTKRILLKKKTSTVRRFAFSSSSYVSPWFLTRGKNGKAFRLTFYEERMETATLDDLLSQSKMRTGWERIEGIATNVESSPSLSFDPLRRSKDVRSLDRTRLAGTRTKTSEREENQDESLSLLFEQLSDALREEGMDPRRNVSENVGRPDGDGLRVDEEEVREHRDVSHSNANLRRTTRGKERIASTFRDPFFSRCKPMTMLRFLTSVPWFCFFVFFFRPFHPSSSMQGHGRRDGTIAERDHGSAPVQRRVVRADERAGIQVSRVPLGPTGTRHGRGSEEVSHPARVHLAALRDVRIGRRGKNGSDLRDHAGDPGTGSPTSGALGRVEPWRSTLARRSPSRNASVRILSWVVRPVLMRTYHAGRILPVVFLFVRTLTLLLPPSPRTSILSLSPLP